MGLFIHFYIIFGANLLTGGPVQIAVFFLFHVSQKKNIKRSPNGMNLRGRDFLTERDPGDLDPSPRNKRGRHEGGGRAPLPRGFLVAFLT